MAALELYQLEEGYCYNTDSLILADFARRFVKKQGTLLDVGAGSGILGALCAREARVLGGELGLHLVEKDEVMSRLCAYNTREFGGVVHCVDFLDFSPPQGIKFDLIISNPPFYAPSGNLGQNDRKNMARFAAFLPLSPMLSKIKQILKPNGVLLMCYDARLLGELMAAFEQRGIHIDELRFIHPLESKPASLVLVKAKIQSKCALTIHPPLYTHLSPRQSDNTQELKDIYAWAQTKSVKIATQEAMLLGGFQNLGERNLV